MAKVLVVEDNETNMELATALIIASGHTAVQAWTAEEAIQKARTDKPALILMDISLPGMDGLTATGLLKQDPETQHIPVLALTAHAMKGDEARAIEAGCVGYLIKPIDTRAFPKELERYLGIDGKV
ncbi:MAG: response regulator [Deltaproteobacteria bacterium]|nr:response regulator [Deltaproteobacteria bacterium]